MTPEEWKAVLDLGATLTVNGVLLAVIAALVVGRLVTGKHHEEVVDDHEVSEKRAWDMVAELTKAREQDNEVLEKFSGNIREMMNTVNVLRATIENRQRR